MASSKFSDPPPRPWRASRLAKGPHLVREVLTDVGGRTNDRCQSLNQTVELRRVRLERSQVIMRTAHSSPSKEFVTATLLVIGRTRVCSSAFRPPSRIIPKVANGMSDLFVEVFGLVPDDRIVRELSIRL